MIRLFYFFKFSKVNCIIVIAFMMMIIPLRTFSSTEVKFILLDMSPWASTSEGESSKLVGILPDVIDEIEKRTGLIIKKNIATYPRIYRELDSMRGDCTILNLRKKYSDRVVEGELLLRLPFGVVANKQAGDIDHNKLPLLSISFLREGMFYEGFNDDERLPRKRSYDTSYVTGLNKIVHGRVNAIAGAIPTIYYLAKKNSVDHLLGQPLVLYSEPIYFQCSRQSSSLHHMKVINLAIQSMREDGVLARIFEKYQ